MKGLKHCLLQRSKVNNESGQRCSVVGKQFRLHWSILTPKLPEPCGDNGIAEHKLRENGNKEPEHSELEWGDEGFVLLGKIEHEGLFFHGAVMSQQCHSLC